MQVINLAAEADTNQELYIYRKIGSLNGHILSVVRVENRTLDFHVHEESDELFYVIEGEFRLELQEQEGIIDSKTVRTGEFIIVPKGICHRPVVIGLTKFLMIELAGTLNKENSGDLYEE